MRKLIILAFIVLGMISCKKEEVQPDNTPVYVLPPSTTVTPPISQPIETNHVKVTFNSIEVGDSIRVTHGINSVLVRITIINDAKYYVCNLGNSISKYLTLVNDCNDGYLEMKGTEIIYVEYKGNVDLEYF